MDSGTPVAGNIIVAGDPKDEKPFTEMCKSGKIVNAYNAFVMAEKMTKKKVHKKVRG